VEHCVTLRAEMVYHQALGAGEPLRPGARLIVTCSVHNRAWQFDAELIANPIWRHGRLFFRCPHCRRRATRLYVPLEGGQPRCRRCWGLNYVSQSWSYRVTGLLAFLGPIAYETTEARRRERRAAALERYAERR